MADLAKKLRSQIGDDVLQVYDKEALFRLAADEIDRLKAAIVWARDRIDVDGGMTEAEAARTATELLNVLRGEPSPASSFSPEPWQSPTMRALEQNKSETRISEQASEHELDEALDGYRRMADFADKCWPRNEK
jgi:hypothetical protein